MQHEAEPQALRRCERDRFSFARDELETIRPVRLRRVTDERPELGAPAVGIEQHAVSTRHGLQAAEERVPERLDRPHVGLNGECLDHSECVLDPVAELVDEQLALALGAPTFGDILNRQQDQLQVIDPARVQHHGAVADLLKLVLDREVVEGVIVREHLFEELAAGAA